MQDIAVINDPAAAQSILFAIRTQARIENLKLRLDNGKDFVLDGIFFRQDASAFFLLRFVPVNPALVAQPALPDLASRTMQFVEEAPDGFVLTDRDGRLLRANTAFLQLAQIESEKWARGEVSIAVEHRAAAICERLIAVRAHQPQGRPRGIAVVSPPPGERHGLPSLMAAACLRDDRWLVHHLAQGGQQPRVHLGRDVVLGVGGEEAAKLGGEFGLAAAAPAQAEVLLDRGALGLAGGAVEVVPQLADRLRASNHRIGSLSSPCVSA